MSDTPITDECEVANNLGEWGRHYAGKPVSLTMFRAAETIRDLERQLADAVEDWRTNPLTRSLISQRDAAERQLAEAREELANWKDAAASAEKPHPDEVHCTCVPLLRGALAESRDTVCKMEMAIQHHERQLAAVTKQRDLLAAGLRLIADGGLNSKWHAECAKTALANLKGDKP